MAARTDTPVLNEQRPFQIDELFFSITDRRGVILHRNDIFSRISGYTTPELIGAPHSILRHPDMPRVVFKLLWDTIEAGQTIAAYVKNLAKDGRYYWVLAVAMPCREGYLSIRLKPTSQLLPVIEQLYSQLLAVEQAIEVEPKRRAEAMRASGERLQAELQSLGFRDYSAFMKSALATEMTFRQTQMANMPSLSRHALRPALPMGISSHVRARLQQLQQSTEHCQLLDTRLQSLFACLDEFRNMNLMLLDKSRAMLDNANSIRFLSINATVAAHLLGSQAQTLGVVAESLGDVSVQSEQTIGQLTGQMNALVESLSGLIFEVAAIKLQSEVSLHFLGEQLEQASQGEPDSSHDLDDVQKSLALLFEEIRKRLGNVYEQLSVGEIDFAALRKCVEKLLRHTSTLRFVQFAGLKESVSVSGADAFRVVFEQAKDQIDKTRQDCDDLAKCVEDNQRHIHTIRDARYEVLSHSAALV